MGMRRWATSQKRLRRILLFPMELWVLVGVVSPATFSEDGLGHHLNGLRILKFRLGQAELISHDNEHPPTLLIAKGGQ